MAPNDYLSCYIRVQQYLVKRKNKSSSEKCHVVLQAFSQRSKDLLNNGTMIEEIENEAVRIGVSAASVKTAAETFLRWLGREKSSLDALAQGGIEALNSEVVVSQDATGELRLRQR